MDKGGILQLVTKGMDDIFLTYDPQITLFKTVYRRYSNYCKVEKLIKFVGGNKFGSKGIGTITRLADLVNKLYLYIDISSIELLYYEPTKEILNNILDPYGIKFDQNIPNIDSYLYEVIPYIKTQKDLYQQYISLIDKILTIQFKQIDISKYMNPDIIICENISNIPFKYLLYEKLLKKIKNDASSQLFSLLIKLYENFNEEIIEEITCTDKYDINIDGMIQTSFIRENLELYYSGCYKNADIELDLYKIKTNKLYILQTNIESFINFIQFIRNTIIGFVDCKKIIIGNHPKEICSNPSYYYEYINKECLYYIDDIYAFYNQIQKFINNQYILKIIYDQYGKYVLNYMSDILIKKLYEYFVSCGILNTEYSKYEIVTEFNSIEIDIINKSCSEIIFFMKANKFRKSFLLLKDDVVCNGGNMEEYELPISEISCDFRNLSDIVSVWNFIMCGFENIYNRRIANNLDPEKIPDEYMGKTLRQTYRIYQVSKNIEIIKNTILIPFINHEKILPKSDIKICDLFDRIRKLIPDDLLEYFEKIVPDMKTDKIIKILLDAIINDTKSNFVGINTNFDNYDDFIKSLTREKEIYEGYVERLDKYIGSADDKLIRDMFKCDRRAPFAWARYLGFDLIDYITVKIGDQEIVRETGTTLYLDFLENNDTNKIRSIDIMLGNIPELYEYNNVKKDKYTLIVPLNFWFCKFFSESLPLICLQYTNVYIELKLKNLEDVAYWNRKYSYFVKEPTIKCKIWGDYIYIDSEERKQIASKKQEYLIEVTEHTGEMLAMEQDRLRQQIYFSNMCKQLTWIIRFYGPCDNRFNGAINEKYGWVVDFDKICKNCIYNQCCNCSNICQYCKDIKFLECKNRECANHINKICLDCRNKICFIHKLNRIERHEFHRLINWIDFGYGTKPWYIQQFKIQFGGVDREIWKPASYYNLVQPYAAKYSSLTDNVFLYSFGLEPKLLQPTGAFNLDMVNDVTLNMNLSELIPPNVKFSWEIMAKNYNVLRIMSGMAGLAFFGTPGI